MKITEILSDDTQIVFQDGNVVKGAESVNAVVIRCCEVYHNAIMKEYAKCALITLTVVGVISGVSYGIGKLIIKSKEKKKISKEEA